MPSRSDDDEYHDRSEEDQDFETDNLDASEDDQEEDDIDEDHQIRPRPRLAASLLQTRRNGRIMRSGRKRPAPASPTSPPPPPKTKRKAGRPKGSKNKPKAAQETQDAPEAPSAAPTDITASNQQTAQAGKPMKPVSEALRGLSRKELTYITYERPMITLARALSYVGPDAPTFDANWTHADERALRYDGSAEKFAISRLNAGSHSRQLTFWKMCLSVCQRSPFDILSPRRGLCYLPSRITDATSKVAWDQGFCREFTDILTHRIWKRDIDVLVTILQYTVICRTDDRRRWQAPTTMIEGGPTVRLRTEMRSYLGPLPTSVHKFHKYIRATGPEVVHCDLSNFLMAIADVVSDRAKRGGREVRWDTSQQFEDGYDVYGVTIADLGIIKEAILRFTRLSTETSFAAFKELKQINRNVIKMADFPNLMRRAWLQEKRHIHCDRGLNGGSQHPMVVVTIPALPQSRRDEFDDLQDEAMTDTEPLMDVRASTASNQGVDNDPPTSPNGEKDQSDDGGHNDDHGGVTYDFDDGGYNTGCGGAFDDHFSSPVPRRDHDMGEDLETPQNDNLHSESAKEENAGSEINRHSDINVLTLEEPSFVESLRSTPPRDLASETDGRHDPDQPLATLESPGSASLQTDDSRPKPLKLKPLNPYRPSSRVGSIGSSTGVVRWRKERPAREQKDREAITKLWKA
ncbi:uncharacterized protein LW94_14411 [Fusarium fujikuroi]|nr:uncharacterized protein LW94_14411 [Fusarium fujikuroi]